MLNPILGVTLRTLNPTSMGCEIKCRIFSHTVSISSRPPMSGRITTNSSPPMRHTVSESRTADTKRIATVFSSSSPAKCPSESLMRLK
tara:strand:- start:124675 stop:124938 length:264 start_codon:yes stop_codon:yes gene_type:complete